MKNLSGLPRNLIELLALMTVILVLFLVIQLFVSSGQGLQASPPTGAPSPGDQPLSAQSKETPIPGSETEVSEVVTKQAPIVPYPAPETDIPLPSQPPPEETPAQPSVEMLSLRQGTAVTLSGQDILLLRPEIKPSPITTSGDIAVIFGWNHDGTKLLFGRGRTVQAEFVGDTTELWVIDIETQQEKQLSPAIVSSAQWSPVDDRIAYCELREAGHVLVVTDLDGKELNQLAGVICTFSWSPEGTGIAVATYTPEMIDTDGLAFTVLSIWDLSSDRAQPILDQSGEVHARPIWSTDGRQVMFLRSYHQDASKQSESGIYVADLMEGVIRSVANPDGVVQEMSRSPRADKVAFRVGTDIFLLNFDGEVEAVGKGHSILWLPDGETLVYRDADNKFQTGMIDVEVMESEIGGSNFAANLYTNPEYYIFQER
jgi:hypothetical protein